VRFDDYDVVALLNLGTFPTAGATADEPYPQLAALEDYVRDGGGLMYFTGDRVDSRFHNQFLWKQGKGLMPFRILSIVGTEQRGREFFRLDPDTMETSSFLYIFGGRLKVLASLIRFFRFTRVDDVPPTNLPDYAGPPRVLGRFTDPESSPAIAERRFGSGQVVTVYSTASKEWNDWPIDQTGSYLTVLKALVQHIARAQGARAERVGEPILHAMNPRLSTATALLRRPDYPKEPEVTLRPMRVDDEAVIRYPRADRMGAYRMEITSATGEVTHTFFARNGDPAEGRLDPAGREGLASAFGGEGFAYRRMRGDGAGADGLEAGAPSRELWPWLIGLLLVFAAMELVLGQRFGHYGNLKDKTARPAQAGAARR
jgi:hypothetical protein